MHHIVLSGKQAKGNTSRRVAYSRGSNAIWAVRELDNTDLPHGVYGHAMKEAINTYTYAYEIVLKKHASSVNPKPVLD